MKRLAVFAAEQHEPLIEGVQKSAFLSCKEFQKNGHELLVFSQRSFGTAFTHPPFKIVDAFKGGGNRILKYAQWFFAGKKIAQAIKEYDPERVIVFSLALPFLSALSAVYKNTRAPVTIAIFSMRELTGPGAAFLKRYAFDSRFTFWTFSTYIAARLRDIGIPHERISVEPVFFTKPAAAVARSKSSNFTVAYLSSGERSAGGQNVLEVAKMLPQMHFIFGIRDFGNQYEKNTASLIKQITTQALPNVKLERTIKDIPSLLARVDAVILPPLSETATMAVPFVALEAAYAGCHVFASDLLIFAQLENLGILKRFKDKGHLTQLLKEAQMQGPSTAAAKTLQQMPTASEFARRITAQ